MTGPGPPDLDGRVLVLAPTARDAAVSRDILAGSGIATFLCKDAEAVQRRIRASKAKILLTGPNSALTVGRFGNHIRFSVSVFNNDKDVDTILEVLA